MNFNDKYRPQDFTEIVGNREIMEQIEGFILSGSIPHLLFYGKPGTGKTTLAEVIAEKVLGGRDSENFIELNASDERGIDDVRKTVIRAIKHLPFGAPCKIIFLDEADGLTKDAQQVLRRPMEKSHGNLFIIACNDVFSIIEPIRSRCAVYFLAPISESETVKGLKRIVDSEGLEISDEQLEAIAREAKGDMRTAVNELQKLGAGNGREAEIERRVAEMLKAQGMTG